MKYHNDHPVQAVRYIRGELHEAELEQFLRHLRICCGCRTEVEGELELSRLLRETKPLYEPPEDLRVRVTGLVFAERSLSRRTQGLIAKSASWIGLTGGKSWRSGTRRRLPLLAAASAALLCFGVTRNLVLEWSARSYAKAVIAAHRDALDGRHGLQIQSDSPEAVTQWADKRVPFHLQLPDVQPASATPFRSRLVGARLVDWKGGRGVLIIYYQRDQLVSLLISSFSAAVVAGGNKVKDGKIFFNYRSLDGFNVTTWNSHGLAYALVSSVAGPARRACLISHGTLPVFPNSVR